MFTGLPPEVSDQAPQGFMGRAFVHSYAYELGLPPDLRDWSDEHLLRAIARRGEDFSGNLIVGQESAERWQKWKVEQISRKAYPALAVSALRGQPVGSSAGGEQPKFGAFVEGCHYLVKFSGASDSLLDERWRDLLVCEQTALTILRKAEIDTMEAKLHSRGGAFFLEIPRFDRIGERGRRSVLSLAAVDLYHFGYHDNWAMTAERLENAHLMSPMEARKLKFLDAFSRLIGDTDRHFHNIVLFPRDTKNQWKTDYRLAPAFDKLPMLFAPVAGQIPDREFTMPAPSAAVLEVWDQACVIALEFWHLVSETKMISASFRKVANRCLKVIRAGMGT
ncbi:MAG: HipA domain-containing protein [Bdellovibrionota bacterium]